ncbi:MAG: PCP reductase family protein, partial [Candidatus Tectomicrobia bacterium]|nr:PCP reductase family protein [Candidatus Tectomicrobia bacterium]
FVRNGIRKVAEKRARKMGATLITGEMLSKFRNEAMMKAVKRIRELGHHELTFEAFDTAKEKIKMLQRNPDAERRLDEIREYVTKKGPIGNIGSELIERMKRYLKDPEHETLPIDEEDS